MAPARIEEPEVAWEAIDSNNEPEAITYKGSPRNIAAIDALKFDESLRPKEYEILGTHPDSKILFTDVNILDSTGREPYRGDVLVEGTNECVGR